MCKNTMFVKGNRGGRGYTLLVEESIHEQLLVQTIKLIVVSL